MPVADGVALGGEGTGSIPGVITVGSFVLATS